MAGKRKSSDTTLGEQSPNKLHRDSSFRDGDCGSRQAPKQVEGSHADSFRNAVENLLQISQQPQWEGGSREAATQASNGHSSSTHPRAYQPKESEARRQHPQETAGACPALPAHMAPSDPNDTKSPLGGLTVAQLTVPEMSAAESRMLPTFSFFPSAHHTLGGREWGSLDVHQHAAGGGGNMLTAHRRSPHSSEMGAGDRSPHAQTWNTQTQHGRAGIDGSALNLHSLLSTETKSAAGGRVGNLVGAKEGVDEGGGQLPYTGRENHEQMLRSMQILQSNQLLQGAYGSAMLQSLMQNQNQQSSSDQPVVTQASRQMSMGLGTSGGMGMSSAMPSLLFHSLVSNMHPSLHGFPQGAGVGFPGVAPGGAGAVNSRSPSLLPSKKLEGVAESLPASSSFSLSDSSDQRDSVAEDSAASPRTGLGAVSGSSKGSPVIAGGSVGRHSKYCHFCQHIKNTMIACTSPQCTFKFCHHCISVHLNEDWEAVTETRERGWRCPCCRNKCCCCTTKICTVKHPHCKAYRKRQHSRSPAMAQGSTSEVQCNA